MCIRDRRGLLVEPVDASRTDPQLCTLNMQFRDPASEAENIQLDDVWRVGNRLRVAHGQSCRPEPIDEIPGQGIRMTYSAPTGSAPTSGDPCAGRAPWQDSASNRGRMIENSADNSVSAAASVLCRRTERPT